MTKPHKLDRAIPLLEAVGIGLIKSDGEYLATDHHDSNADFDMVSELDTEGMDALYERLMAIHKVRGAELRQRKEARSNAFMAVTGAYICHQSDANQ